MQSANREPGPVFDRIPPHNVEAEKAVLGAILLNPDAWSRASEILPAVDGSAFYVEAHQHIWAACHAVRSASYPLDEITLANELRRSGKLDLVGGLAYVAKLFDAVPTSANVDYYARLVANEHALRCMIGLFQKYAQPAYNENVTAEQIRGEFLAEFNPIGIDLGIEHSTAAHAIDDSADRIQNIIDGNHSGVPTGWKSLDDILWGWEGYCGIVGRTSSGKTAFSLACAVNAAQSGRHVLYFSIEMDHPSIGGRLASMISGVDWEEVHTGRNKQWQLTRARTAANEARALPLWIEDPAKITVSRISRRIEKSIREHKGIDIVFIDYLQLCDPDSVDPREKSRSLELTKVSQGIKAISKSLGIPIVVLCQLNRDAENTLDPWEMKGKVSECDHIYMDLDKMVIIVGFTKDQADRMRKKNKNDWSYEEKLEAAVTKNRNGKQGSTLLHFDKPRQTFCEVDFRNHEHQSNPKPQPTEREEKPREHSPPQEMIPPDEPFEYDEEEELF